MPSPYDILGVLFGVISLLCGFRYLYKFLKSRQSPARAAELVTALKEARNRLEELERHTSRHSASAATMAYFEDYRRSLDRLEEDSHIARCKATAHAPDSVFAVVVYAFQHGIECERAREICDWIEDVRRVYAVLGDEAIASRSLPGPPSCAHAAVAVAQESQDSATHTMLSSLTPSGAWRYIDGAHVQHRLETLAQYGYQYMFRAEKLGMELVVPYCFAPLTLALNHGGISSPDEPAFAYDAPIGVKLSICISPQEIQPPLSNIYFTRQYRVRSGGNVPITRANLARCIAIDLHTLMENHTLMHKGRPVDFSQLRLVEVRLKSKATIQPVFAAQLPTDGGMPMVYLP